MNKYLNNYSIINLNCIYFNTIQDLHISPTYNSSAPVNTSTDTFCQPVIHTVKIRVDNQDYK